MTKAKILKRFIAGVLVLGLIYFIAVPVHVVTLGRKAVYKDIANIPDYPVVIVFGAGLKSNGKPSDVLKDRLNTAATLYKEDRTQKILVSGDNREENYNEPEAMFKYLTEELEIPEEDVVRDYAGRRTYDTCVRANEIFGVENALLITQGFHLPRAIFTCNALGVKAAGFSSTIREYLDEERFKVREIIAIHKAVFDIYIWSPEYISGQKEDDLQNL